MHYNDLRSDAVKLIDGTDKEIVIDGANTASWWRRMIAKYLEAGCYPVVLRFFSDGTGTGASGDAHPVMLTIENLDEAIQKQEVGKTCVGYVPKVVGIGTSITHLALKRKVVYHRCYEELGKSIIKANDTKIVLRLGDKVVRLQFFVHNMLADGPESDSMCLVLSSCNRCMCPKTEFGSDRDDYEPRLVEEMRGVIQELAASRAKRRRS